MANSSWFQILVQSPCYAQCRLHDISSYKIFLHNIFNGLSFFYIFNGVLIAIGNYSFVNKNLTYND